MSRRYISSFWPESDGSTLTLDFTTGVLDSRLTFTRASTTATYINSSGYVTTAGTNVPRFDHDPTTRAPRGLLVEGQTPTINTYSESFDNAAWIATQIDKTGMTSSQTDPAGGTNARILKADANAGRHAIYQIPGNNTNPGTGTLTVWAKSKELVFASLQLANAFESKSVTVTFDLATGATSGVVSTGMTHVASDAVQFRDGWWRLRLTATLTVGASPDDRMLPWIGLANASGSAGRSFTASGSGIFIWGAQLEAGSGASSYIPTGASTATRNADECSMTGTNFSSWFTGITTGYSMLWSCSPQSRQSGSFPPMVCIRGPSDSGSRSYYYNDGTYNTAHRTSNGTTASEAFGPNSLTYGVARKFAISVTNGSQLVSSNGATANSNTQAITSFNQTIIGFGNDAGSPLGALTGRQHFQSFKFWPTALPQATLNSLTTL